jgi:hypothetical protein
MKNGFTSAIYPGERRFLPAKKTICHENSPIFQTFGKLRFT